MKKIILWLILGLGFVNLFSQTEITSSEIYDHISYLADDAKKGRFPGTPESKEVAKYIAQEFKNYGLKLLADDGFQYFKIQTKAELGKSNSLKINKKKFVVGKDYLPLTVSKNGKFSGSAVIVGYGIEKITDSLTWNDYKNINVKGKWVIVFRGYPQNNKYPEDFFNDVKSDMSKIYKAKEKGAIGIIFISPKDQFKQDLIPFTLPRFYSRADIAAISVSEKVARYIFNFVKLTYEKYYQYINEKPFVWDELNLTVEALISVVVPKVQTQNVVALLEGSDPKLKNRYIVIGAHYDHLGMGGYESGSRMPDTIAVHNGADDNASGVAGVLELAEYLAAHKDKIGRSILFIAFGAEERGLLGSQYFVDNPLVPLDSIDLMINMDMIGKYGKSLSIIAVGSGKQLKNILESIPNDTNQIKLRIIENFYGGSDHASFYNANIPALFFYASTAEDYHTPFDDVEKIRPEKEKQILDFIAQFAIKVSNYPEKIEFQNVKTSSGNKKHSYSIVTMGIIPSYGSSEDNGLKISGVKDGKPAQKAGLKAGDIIVKIDQYKISNIYEYMEAMKHFKKGDKIKVEVLRNNKKMIFDVQL